MNDEKYDNYQTYKRDEASPIISACANINTYTVIGYDDSDDTRITNTGNINGHIFGTRFLCDISVSHKYL